MICSAARYQGEPLFLSKFIPSNSRGQACANIEFISIRVNYTKISHFALKILWRRLRFYTSVCNLRIERIDIRDI